MRHSKIVLLFLSAALWAAGNSPSGSQTLGYADAIDELAVRCGADIDKHCKKIELGGGRIQQCLNQNQAQVSPLCKASVRALGELLQKRAAARASVARICDRDRVILCAGIQPGDGNLMECFYKVKRNVSGPCRKVISDAGYEVSLSPNSGAGPINLSSGDLVQSLQNAEATVGAINASRLRQLVESGQTRDPLFDQLNSLPQFTIAVQFDFDSARIRPDSFRAIGLMADALYHPYLQGYRFLVVGHTDAKGTREYNLKLSQKRADAIRAALINPFGISASRIEAVGVGEEQLLNQRSGDAAVNRRVQLINIGK
jgi:outer membrane protein OmpA-like peptidoglycan-associated protein